jgi:hypothetical protein
MPKSRLSTSTSSIPDGREVHNEKLIEAFRTQIKNHTTEDPRVQLFINLLDDLFDSGNYTKEFLNKYLEGHEKTIKVNRNSYIIRGRTDGLFGNVIIEYERDLKSRAKFDEAQEQLRRYSAILWEEGIDYIAIASDCEEFIAYSPISRNDHQPSTEDIELREISRINLQQAEPRDFYFWLDRFFFREQKLDPTTKNILDDFGPHSHTLNKIESELGLLLDRHFADKQIE